MKTVKQLKEHMAKKYFIDREYDELSDELSDEDKERFEEYREKWWIDFYDIVEQSIEWYESEIEETKYDIWFVNWYKEAIGNISSFLDVAWPERYTGTEIVKMLERLLK